MALLGVVYRKGMTPNLSLITSCNILVSAKNEYGTIAFSGSQAPLKAIFYGLI